VISPDLSTQDRTRVVSSGGIAADNLGQFAGEVVFAIAPSELQKGLIWAGTNDGKVWNTRDGGAHWSDLTAKIGGMPAWGAVTKIEPSHFDAATAYVAVDAHLMDNRDPFIFKTSDFGASWSRVNGDLPARHPLSYVRAVAEDPYRRGLLFAGTGHGFFYSVDDGVHWTELAAGLPHAPVTWVAVQKRFHDVVVSTYGRGLYVLDDVTPLEQEAAPATTSATLFAPRATYRWVSGSTNALITYTLPSPPKDIPRLEILDAAGAVVRTIARVPRDPGLARVAWNLRYDPPRLAELRTTPESNPLIWSEPRFRGKDTRPITHWGLAPTEVGPLVAPGRYTVRLTVDGHTLTESLEVLKDPRLPSSDEDIQASTKLQLRIRDDVSRAADMINRIEIIRRQLQDVRKGAAGKTEMAEAIKAAEQLEARARAVEEILVEPAQMNSDDKYFSQSFRVYMNLLWLNGEVGPGAGDVAGGQDFRPTDTSIAVLETIEQELAAAEMQYKNLLAADLPAFNRAVRGTGVAPIPD
jgi:hypothetical protein